MKVYFSASIAQREEYGEVYGKVISTLESLGHVVQHEHITGGDLSQIKSLDQEALENHYKKVLQWINAAEIVVVEASFPSTLNIGHEITLSLEKGKPVIVLYEKGKSSLFLNGLVSDRFFLVEYTRDNLIETLKTVLEFASETSDTRFNFFVAPKHITYLDWIAKTKRIPRSVYLRKLIEKDKAANHRFLKAEGGTA